MAVAATGADDAMTSSISTCHKGTNNKRTLDLFFISAAAVQWRLIHRQTDDDEVEMRIAGLRTCGRALVCSLGTNSKQRILKENSLTTACCSAAPQMAALDVQLDPNVPANFFINSYLVEICKKKKRKIKIKINSGISRLLTSAN